MRKRIDACSPRERIVQYFDGGTVGVGLKKLSNYIHCTIGQTIAAVKALEAEGLVYYTEDKRLWWRQ